jgi:hypothetical protein
MEVRAIDIRYNLEFIGLKDGIGVINRDSKLEYYIGKKTEKQIKEEISHNGCPNHIEGYNFKRLCAESCKQCWAQKAEGMLK